ncbi:MAG: hypothetical protein AVDCRST_MAG20-2052, partial [uncultured Acidimicrobiales bacterium]
CPAAVSPARDVHSIRSTCWTRTRRVAHLRHGAGQEAAGTSGGSKVS